MCVDSLHYNANGQFQSMMPGGEVRLLQYVLLCRDAAGAPELRARFREEHVAHVRGSGMVRLAGPLTDEAGGVIGSLLIVEATELAAVQAFSQTDPFQRQGVYESVDILPFRMTYVDIAAKD